MAKYGKRTTEAKKAFAGKFNVTVEDAVALIKANSKAKFDETVEIAMNLGVDPRHADQMVRGVVNLPNGTGKSVRVAVFARGPKAEEAQKAGADIVGAEDLMEIVQGGQIDFDRCIATPDMMPIVGRLGKVLGPRNLMPNPKIGTVTMDIKEAVEDSKGGQVQFKVEKAGVVHAGIGKVSFDEAKLIENIRSFVEAVAKARPAGSKGEKGIAGEKGIKGEAGNDGIGLHLKTFKVGDRYSKGDYVFEKSTRNDHEEKTMYIAQKSFTADVEPYKNKNGACT